MLYYVVTKEPSQKYVAGPFYKREDAAKFMGHVDQCLWKIVRTMSDIAPRE